MKTNSQRYWDRLMELSKITDPQTPYTRRSFTPLFLKGREWLSQQMQMAGLSVHIDSAGNLIGRKQGKKSALGTIMLGSHSDTVPAGGRFDGIAGVIAALECAYVLEEQCIELNHDLEIIDFLAEEPSEWGISCVGSRGITGYLDLNILNTKHSNTQETLAHAINRVGGNSEQLKIRNDIAYFLELHIEQGAVLENQQIPVGVVTGIVGIIRLSIKLQGQSNHAGTTPMTLRHDSLVTAAQIIVKAQSLAQTFSEQEGGYFVATCGQVVNHPNASNVIPGQTELVFDIRSDQRQWMEDFLSQLKLAVQTIAKQQGVELTAFERLTDSYPMHCDPYLVQVIKESSQRLNLAYLMLPSGAGHDAAFMGKICPSAMVFVPSKEGKSHCAEEWTSPEELQHGVDVLFNTLLTIDQKGVCDV